MTASTLVIIDMQHVFCDPQSQWAVPAYRQAEANILRLMAHHRGSLVCTKFVRDPAESGSWHDYYQRWDECREAPDSAVWDLTFQPQQAYSTVTCSTFSKWGDELAALTEQSSELLICGVATDCCVLATALGAVDAGKRVTIVHDACAGTNAQVHSEALSVMGMLAPMVKIVSTDELISEAGAA